MKPIGKIGAAKPAATKYPILRAKPVKGEVDHAALSREHIARFPKLRAALAKAEATCKRKNEG